MAQLVDRITVAIDVVRGGWSPDAVNVCSSLSQWSDAQADAQSESAILRADSGRNQTAATQQTIIDSQTWLEWVGAVDANQTAKAGVLGDRFSPSLKPAQAE